MSSNDTSRSPHSVPFAVVWCSEKRHQPEALKVMRTAGVEMWNYIPISVPGGPAHKASVALQELKKSLNDARPRTILLIWSDHCRFCGRNDMNMLDFYLELRKWLDQKGISSEVRIIHVRSLADTGRFVHDDLSENWAAIYAEIKRVADEKRPKAVA